MFYEFKCIDHPSERWSIVCGIEERDGLEIPKCPECGAILEPDLKGHGGSWFKQTFGKWTGVYDYDLGKKATWDLTPPGKMDRLKHDGVIRDPFDYGPPPVTNDHLVGEL